MSWSSILAAVAVVAGCALAASVTLLAVPAPLYLPAGILIGALPRVMRRTRKPPPRWIARVRTGPLVDKTKEKNYYGQYPSYEGIYVECVRKGSEPIFIAGFDIRKDDCQAEISRSLAAAEDKAAYLNAVVA